ncbi:MAG: thioredoxin-disulfide reductase [Bacteroidales bacterium]|nr:thioredoxin-disulfide reductase [Bacteroidales bacterium]
METTKCLIIGGGPAGYTAGIYASRADLKPILIEGPQPGGQLTITTEVENFPGYPKGMSGPAIMDDIREQSLRCGTDMRSGMVTEVDFSKRPFRCVVDDTQEILAETVIIATGATARWLGLESEKTYRGFGVSACATCDGNFFRGKDVAVVGGGDTALEEATYLANLCNKVYLVHRRDEFRASKAMQQRVFDTPNIEVVWNSIPAEIVGEKRGFMKAVTGLAVTDKNSGALRTLPVDGVFVAIGHTPVTELFKDQIELDPQGYIVTKPDSTATSVDGVFAAGDVQDPHFRQAITAAASGCKAAIEAERFLVNTVPAR